jgi:TonB-dependent receptor
VPGVQIQRGLDDTAGSSSGDGEGSTVSIRGMRPDLNKTTVNGASQSSTTGGRDFNFSNLAPELVQRIEVFKTPTADQDEGAIGGTINLVTRKPREIGKFKAVGAAKITQHQLADATNYKLSGLVSNVFGDNDRVGALLSVNYSDDELRRDSVESFGWNIMTDAGGDTGLVARDIRPGSICVRTSYSATSNRMNRRPTTSCASVTTVPSTTSPLMPTTQQCLQAHRHEMPVKGSIASWRSIVQTHARHRMSC